MATILCIDDDPSLRDLVRLVLEEAGYTVALATSGAQALRLAAQLRPDLILLDIVLPDTDGLALIPQLQAVSAAPIVILSALARDLDVAAGQARGAVEYIVKPFHLPELLDRITAVLQRSPPGQP